MRQSPTVTPKPNRAHHNARRNANAQQVAQEDGPAAADTGPAAKFSRTPTDSEPDAGGGGGGGLGEAHKRTKSLRNRERRRRPKHLRTPGCSVI